MLVGGVPLDLTETYKVGTNEFLAPAGQDGFLAFKYMTSITYWGDMLDQVNAYVAAHHGTSANPYKGPTGNGQLDGRITRDGTDAGGSIVPLMVLHHNDSHGNLLKGTYVGYTQLATLIAQERVHNPDRTLLVTGGDNIQGDAMMYYFKSAGLGYAADGKPLPADLQINPLIKAFNTMGYDAMVLGNHEFNFGSQIFRTLEQATFPLLQANNPITTGQALAPGLDATSDVVIALTHIGFTTNPKSVEVDTNVDTAFAAEVPGVDAIIGAHSHTNPAAPEAPYKYLPTIVAGPGGAPVEVTQAYRYNNTLGEIVLGLKAKPGGGYEVVTRAGQYLSVAMSTPEDPAIKAIVDPYQALLNGYDNTVIGQTTVPIDATQAYTQETNGANLQADASVWMLGDNGIDVDVHLSGAMSNRKVADGATAASPYTLKVSDMFTLMPYENSLVVMNMNGPQLKKVLERSYRNYYYYKYVPGYGGYSYDTTCMLDTDKGNQIVYHDDPAVLPTGDNVLGLFVQGKKVDFADASTYYRVSTVNYLAAGACNFSDSGTTLWPLNQIANDTQFYVRDAVIDYTQAHSGPISPTVEGRLWFAGDLPPAPVVQTVVAAPEPSVEGQAVTVTATFDDPAPKHGPFACTVGFGDGTPPVAGTVTETDTGIAMTCVSPPHTYTSYAKPGQYVVTVTVTDALGSAGTKTAVHDVNFAFGGPFPPLKPSGNVAKAGSTIPVKFSVGGYRGMDVLTSAKVGPCGTGTGTTIIAKLQYHAPTKTYSFLWKTAKTLRGCQTLTLTLKDGTTHTVDITFR